MGIGDFASAMLGLIIFFILPWLIISYLAKKINEISYKRKLKKDNERIKGEKDMIVRKYDSIIQRGIHIYYVFCQCLSNPEFLHYVSENKVQFVRRNRTIFAVLPIAASSRELLKYWEEEYEKLVDSRRAPNNCWFEQIDDCEDVLLSGITESYCYALVNSIGWLNENSEMNLSYEAKIIVDEIIKRVNR